MSIQKNIQDDSNYSIIKSTSVLSAGTLVSRFLGFFRDIILARLLGTGIYADAFFVAFRIPNLFRSFVGEGTVNSAVIPVFTECLQKQKKKGFFSLVNHIFIISFILLILMVILGIVLSPLIVRILAPGFSSVPDKMAVTIRLTQIMFPYLLFIGMSACCMAALYTLRLFFFPAVSQCIVNLTIIISVVVSALFIDVPVYGIACGVVVGGFIQFLLHLYALFKAGLKLELFSRLYHPGAVKISRLLMPRMVGAGVYQLTVFIDTFCASWVNIVGAGGISAIYYANRLIQLPMGVFIIALSSVLLPVLSGFADKKDKRSLKKALCFSLENTFFIMIPAAVFLAIFSYPIIQTLFQRGEFGPYSTHITSKVLLFYALGLPAFGGNKILVTGFHSLQDTKTPVKIAGLCLGINALLNVVLMFPLKIGGIALASSMAGIANFFMLYRNISNKLNINMVDISYIVKIVLSSIIMGIVCVAVWNFLTINQWIRMGITVILSVLIYLFASFLLHIKQTVNIFIWFQKIFWKQKNN